MKEELRKLKGFSIATDMGEITLTDTFRENDSEFDQLYFYTEHDSITVKVYDLEKEESHKRFSHEQQIYLRQTFEELAVPLLLKQIDIKKHPFGFVALKTCRGSTLRQTASSLSYSDWLSVVQLTLSFIERLRTQKQVYLNLQPSNIARNSFSEFKITDPQYLTSEGSYQEVEAIQEQFFDLCQKEYLYKAPELLDQYCKTGIDHRADLFSFGVILYEMLYHQYPFESKLAQINCSYRPCHEESFFSVFISKLLRPVQLRETVENLKIMVENERKKVPRQINQKSMSSGSTTQSKGSGLFSGLTQMFSKLTTQTESWYLNFTENDGNAPEEKYLNLLVSKLYKKEAKLEKLQQVMQKYLHEDSQIEEFRFLKTIILMIQLLRRGPNSGQYHFSEALQLIEEKSGGSLLVTEVCQFFKQKTTIFNKYRPVFRGNFYLDDISKFKLITTQTIEDLQSYLSWLINSMKSKILFSKKQEAVIESIKQIYCDEILDVISMVIFSIVSIRKDNQLKLRKDPLDRLKEFEKKVNGDLQKISYLSNHVNSHAIYSLESEYLYYQEEIQLRETPFHTSFQHFVKYAREYKGLCLPTNYSLTYSTADTKEFLSGDRIERNTPKKEYFADEEEEQNQPSFKALEPSPEKQKMKEKFLELIKQRPKKEIKPVFDPAQLFNQKVSTAKSQIISEPPKKKVNFDEFFKMEPKPNQSIPNPPALTQKKGFSFADFGKKSEVTPKLEKKPEDFSFFDDFLGTDKQKKQQQKPVRKVDPEISAFFDNFPPRQLKVKQKSSIASSSSQKALQQIFQVKGVQKSMFPLKSSPQKSKFLVDPQLLKNILSGLRLKELKQIITENQNIIISFDQLKLQKVIGSGSAGEVYVGRFNNQLLAIKKVKTKENPNALKQFERQLLTYIKIKRNPYLVSLVGLSKSEEDYYLLTQFCNAGSLFDLLHKRAKEVPLSWKQRITLAIQIAQGMHALHDRQPPIIHRDLKSLNVFVIEDKGNFIAKVADFGLSRSPESEMMTMYLGTLHWMAPQLLDNKQYSIKVDIYSFAVVLWEICARKTPYNDLSSPMAIIKHVTMEMKRPNLSLIPPDCPPGLIQIMKDCWSHQPQNRPGFAQIIERLSKVPVLI